MDTDLVSVNTLPLQIHNLNFACIMTVALSMRNIEMKPDLKFIHELSIFRTTEDVDKSDSLDHSLLLMLPRWDPSQEIP